MHTTDHIKHCHLFPSQKYTGDLVVLLNFFTLFVVVVPKQGKEEEVG